MTKRQLENKSLKTAAFGTEFAHGALAKKCFCRWSEIQFPVFEEVWDRNNINTIYIHRYVTQTVNTYVYLCM